VAGGLNASSRMYKLERQTAAWIFGVSRIETNEIRTRVDGMVCNGYECKQGDRGKSDSMDEQLASRPTKLIKDC
jgi:hypothetical protein